MLAVCVKTGVLNAGTAKRLEHPLNVLVAMLRDAKLNNGTV
jgi:hypothetical protein